uniref:Uncharacterized protein n=1 Tax=Anguilla anguilla TaxID=7936 RepID=A0A0E9W3U0_ANGAN
MEDVTSQIVIGNRDTMLEWHNGSGELSLRD